MGAWIAYLLLGLPTVNQTTKATVTLNKYSAHTLFAPKHPANSSGKSTATVFNEIPFAVIEPNYAKNSFSILYFILYLTSVLAKIFIIIKNTN
jgi:hypothetical protein